MSVPKAGWQVGQTYPEWPSTYGGQNRAETGMVMGQRTGALCPGHAEALPRWSVLGLGRVGVMRRSEAGLGELSCPRSGGSRPAHICSDGRRRRA